MKVYIVLVTYNGAPWIRGALDSVRASKQPCIAVVVDNASTDDTVEIIKREYPETILIASPTNTGFGIGNNIGIQRAFDDEADYIFLLNQDAFLTADAILLLTSFLEKHPEFGLASPLHCSPDEGSLDPQTQRTYLQAFAPDYLSDACVGLVQDFYPIRGINAAAWMVRPQVFAKVGGFDPLFFMYGEDDDMIARFAYHDEKFALVPASRVVHLRARSIRPTPPLATQLWNLSERARSDLLTDFKHPAGGLAGKTLRLLAAGLILPFGRLLLNHDWKVAVSYWLATLRVVVRSPVIRRHGRLCATVGPHFLSAGHKSDE